MPFPLKGASSCPPLSPFERTLAGKKPPQPPAPHPTSHFLSDVSGQPLRWLWPGRIPLGYLTLLDAAPDSGLSHVALSLAACVSRGSPLPDGTPMQQGKVILFAPYAFALKARLKAAEGDPAQVVLAHPLVSDAVGTLASARPYTFPKDLDYLSRLIITQQARLVIIDPASAIPGLSRCLPALRALASQSACSILLTCSLAQSPAHPFHAPCPASPLLEAAASRLLLTPDPADHHRHLLLTTKHPLCTQPATLAYTLRTSAAGHPTMHWLGEQDLSHLLRLSSGPLHSPHRQAILRFLQTSTSPRSHKEILDAACYDDRPGRKMIWRMKLAGELVCTDRGLYTTPNHPCLAPSTDQAPSAPNAPDVSTSPSLAPAPSPQSDGTGVPPVPSPPGPAPASSTQTASDVPPVPAVPLTDHTTSTHPPVPPVLNVPNVPTSDSPPPAPSPQSDVTNAQPVSPAHHPAPAPGAQPDSAVPPVPAVPLTDHIPGTISPVPNVPNVPNPPHSTGEAAQQHLHAPSKDHGTPQNVEPPHRRHLNGESLECL